MIPGISTNVGSKSGDSSAGLDGLFSYQGAFQVGGSGSQDQAADLTASLPQKSNVALYVALGALAVVALLSLRE